MNKARDDPRASLAGYFAAVTAMDSAIGRLLDELDQLEIAESTLVWFLSDNGFNAGHHGIWGKGNGTLPQNAYETSVRVPSIVRQPGRVPAGVRLSELASTYDVRATILDWVSVDDGRFAQPQPGQSLALLLEKGAPQRDYVVALSEYGSTRMIATHNRKYVDRWPTGPNELYCLDIDPDERRNVVDDPSRTKERDELKSKLETWFSQYVVEDRDGRKYPITGRGQVGLLEEPEPFAPEV